MLDHLQQNAMQPVIALEKRAAHIEHDLDRHHKDRIAVLDQLADAGLVGPSGDGADEEFIEEEL